MTTELKQDETSVYALFPVSEASLQRRQLARRPADACPPELGLAIALTGSAARGLAEEESDLELNFYTSSLPSEAERRVWLQAQGVTDVGAGKTRSDSSVWHSGVLDGIFIEAGWQTFAALDAMLETAQTANADVEQRALAELMWSALPLRPHPTFSEWQARLNHYPNALAAHIRQQGAQRLADEAQWATLRMLAFRGERLAFLALLIEDLNLALSAVYAANGRWEPSPKWRLTLAETLEYLPESFFARLYGALDAEPLPAILTTRSLLIDAVRLFDR